MKYQAVVLYFLQVILGIAAIFIANTSLKYFNQKPLGMQTVLDQTLKENMSSVNSEMYEIKTNVLTWTHVICFLALNNFFFMIAKIKIQNLLNSYNQLKETIFHSLLTLVSDIIVDFFVEYATLNEYWAIFITFLRHTIMMMMITHYSVILVIRYISVFHQNILGVLLYFDMIKV